MVTFSFFRIYLVGRFDFRPFLRYLLDIVFLSPRHSESFGLFKLWSSRLLDVSGGYMRVKLRGVRFCNI